MLKYYKGYEIDCIYLPGADFKIRGGLMVKRKPKREDIDFYMVCSPDGRRWIEATIEKVKQSINEDIG